MLQVLLELNCFDSITQKCQTIILCLYSESTILFPQISSEALSQLAYNLFKFMMSFKVINFCQLEKEPLANVQEIFSLTIEVSRTSIQII